jgi:hypothetical protein
LCIVSEELDLLENPTVQGVTGGLDAIRKRMVSSLERKQLERRLLCNFLPQRIVAKESPAGKLPGLSKIRMGVLEGIRTRGIFLEKNAV